MDPAKLKVVELRAQLSQRGLDAKGNKPVLVERLRKALEEEISNRDQEKGAKNVENAHDTASKENEETGTESVKSTPKPSGRSSRSSSMVTPTKISTRSAPRTPATSNSIKQPSPSKTQRVEVACEILPTIPEVSAKEQADKKEVQTTSSPEKVKDTEEKSSSSLENEAQPPSTITVEDESKDVNVDEKCKDDEKLSQTSVAKSPKKVSEPVEPIEELEDNEDSKPLECTQESAISPKKEVIDDESNTVKEESAVPCTNNDSNECEDDKTVVKEEEVADKEENVALDDNAQCTDSLTEIEKADSPKDERKEESVPNAESKVENDDINDKMEIAADEATEDKDMESVEEKKMMEEEHESIADKNTEQDAEMSEIPDEEATKPTTNDQEENECIQKDRKRKRSPSPAEESRVSPIPQNSENEPEIDDNALILSWYDSDLNLVIDANGFFTATPMHTDGFSRMWAGARASYGFLHGKVYYESKIRELCSINTQGESHPHVLRIGWSTPGTSMQLGEEKFSYGYDSTGKKATDNAFSEYGVEFGKDDIIGCYLDATSESDIVLSYTVNGKDLGAAFNISKQELGDKPLFPHILSKNCSFACNFGQEKPWAEEILENYVSIGNVDSEFKVAGPRRPEKREDCEIIMMCGLPACGKTTWAMKHATEHPQKMYNVLGIESLIDKMKNMGLPCKENYTGRWEVLVDKCARALDKLVEMAPSRRRNYILDQTNVYASAQRRKMKNFSGFQRRAVVIVPTEEEFKLRASKHKPVEGKEVPDSTLVEMKANFSAPVVGEYFEAVDWVELGQEAGRKLIEKYNKEGKEVGFGQQQQANKRPRMDKPEGNRENRDVRSNQRDIRDHRDRRGNYPDRNRNPIWRGGGNMGWRDRPQRGGHIRHGGGYGPPIPWRGRGGAPVPPPHRGLERRGGVVDRRTGNDRSRPAGNRQGGGHWNPMSNYQGSQQPVWDQQSNWSGGQSQGGGWGQQQGGWGPHQWGNWKGYNQGSYNQTNYSQQGYGNGNWNSWNQQYYNQYWDHQQQAGQTTAAGAGQAVSKP